MKISKLLLATDLSDEARHSYGHAAALAATLGATLDVLHVDELAELAPGNSAELDDYLAVVAELREQRLAALDAELEALGAPYELHLRTGVPSQQILAFADEHDSDLIVVAKHGGGRGVRHLFMGFTAKRLVRHARVPVLVVPPPSAEADTEPAQPDAYRELLVATDFSYESERGLVASIDLARQLDAHVHVVHVAKVPSYLPTRPPERFSLTDLTHRMAWLSESRRAELEALTAELGEERLSYEVVLGGNPAEELARVAARRGSSLIAIPSQGKGAIRSVIFGSTTERLLGVAEGPVLVLPKEFLERPWTAEL